MHVNMPVIPSPTPPHPGRYTIPGVFAIRVLGDVRSGFGLGAVVGCGSPYHHGVLNTLTLPIGAGKVSLFRATGTLFASLFLISAHFDRREDGEGTPEKKYWMIAGESVLEEGYLGKEEGAFSHLKNRTTPQAAP